MFKNDIKKYRKNKWKKLIGAIDSTYPSYYTNVFSDALEYASIVTYMIITDFSTIARNENVKLQRLQYLQNNVSSWNISEGTFWNISQNIVVRPT